MKVGESWKEYTYIFLAVEHSELERNNAPSVFDWLYSMLCGQVRGPRGGGGM